MKKRFLFATLMAALFTTATFTACEEDDEDDDSEVLATNVDFSKLTTVAQSDGTILIEGSVTANGKIKTFELQDFEGKTIADLKATNEKSVEKDENGKKVKTYTMDIASVAVPVQKMKLVFKVKDGDTGKGVANIGEDINTFYAGTGNSKHGSYMSFYNNASYTFDQVVDQETGEAIDSIASKVEVILGKNDAGKLYLKSADEAKNAKFAAASAKAKVFDEAVLTSTNCIAKYVLTPGEDGETATITGVIIKKGDGGIMQIDNSALFK